MRVWERGARWVLVVVALLSAGGCSALMARRKTDLHAVRLETSRQAIEASIGKPIREEPVAGGMTSARYGIHVPDAQRSERNLVFGMFTYGLSELVMMPMEWTRTPEILEILYGADGRAIAARGSGAPGAQIDATRRALLQPVLGRIRSGDCPRLVACVDGYETALRGASRWMGYKWTPADDSRLEAVEKVAADGDAGRLPRDEAVKKLTATASAPSPPPAPAVPGARGAPGVGGAPTTTGAPPPPSR